MLKKFNIRVYGLLIEKGRILLVDEMVKGREITKFPGGGLELGEGTKECLVREFKEETGLDVFVESHFYTTDFFQRSAFNEEHQIISIYYLVKNAIAADSEIRDIPYGSHVPTETILSFRWISLQEITPADVTLPIDKRVVEEMIKSPDSLSI